MVTGPELSIFGYYGGTLSESSRFRIDGILQVEVVGVRERERERGGTNSRSGGDEAGRVRSVCVWYKETMDQEEPVVVIAVARGCGSSSWCRSCR
jgi:hypothetical protein